LENSFAIFLQTRVFQTGMPQTKAYLTISVAYFHSRPLHIMQPRHISQVGQLFLLIYHGNQFPVLNKCRLETWNEDLCGFYNPRFLKYENLRAWSLTGLENVGGFI